MGKGVESVLKRQLILEDGTVFIGEAFGSTEDVMGEVVFHTGMTGYQEVLTDPSFAGQIVTMTYPLIGNYGINLEDMESFHPAVKGLIVKEAAEFPSNFRSQMTINEFCQIKNIPGLQGIDTRKLTRLIRKSGFLKGMLCGIEVDREEIIQLLKFRESQMISCHKFQLLTNIQAQEEVIGLSSLISV